MPYSVFYRHRPCRMISYGVSPYSELARWVLDRRGVEYREHSHIPLLHFLLVRQKDELPGLVVPERTLSNAREIIEYWEARCPRAEKLIPGGDPEVRALFERFYWTTGMAARRWAYYYMLPDRRATLRCWKQGSPAWEGLVATLAYPVMKAILVKGINLTPAAPAESMAELDDCFRMVEERLRDGRRYLAGDRLTVADIAFAALVAPALLPAGYGGPTPTLDEAPEAMRAGVLRLRETAAGQFALRLYREDRGAPVPPEPGEPSGIGAFFNRVKQAITGSPMVLRAAFWALRRFRPVLIAGKNAIVARHADVVDVLGRDEEFTIAEINADRMARAHATFFLAMDRSARYDREAGLLRRAMAPGDLETIRGIVARNAAELVAGAREGRRLDVVTGLTRIVPTRVVAEFFGTPGPDEQTMIRWLEVLFYEVFLNRGDTPEISRTAARYADLLRDYLADLIAQRQRERDAGTLRADDLLSRLVKLQSGPGDSLDDDGIRRNISGLIVGAVATTSAAVAQAVEQLLRRPGPLAAARRAAVAGDVEAVAKYALEALRFNPQTPGILRFCRAGAVVAGGTGRATAVPPGSQVVLATLSAMFDPDAFANPGQFRVDRPAPAYLHFGSGMHTCFGRMINLVQIPEIVAALLRAEGLRAAGGIAYDGPFPDRLIVEFAP